MSDDQPSPTPAGPPVRTSEGREERPEDLDDAESTEDRAEAADGSREQANEPTGGDDIGA